MGEAGILAPDARVELIDGEIIEMSPQGSRHFTAMRQVEAVLRRVFHEGFDVRMQGPLDLNERNQPEPDVAVVKGHMSDFLDAHPSEAVLVVEVSNTTLAFDQTNKVAVYAQAHIPEYWIVNLVDYRLEVYRDPRGDLYRTKVIYEVDDQLTPLAKPESTIDVADLLP